VKSLLFQTLAVLVLSAGACSHSHDTPDLSPYLGISGKKILVTTNAYTPGIDFAGPAAADSLCGADPGIPISSVFKAFLSDGATRVATTSGNCSSGCTGRADWVLGANTTYLNASGANIFTTDANAIFVFGQMGTNFGGAGSTPWTGLVSDWTSAASNCTGWTSQATNGTTGNDMRIDAGAIYFNTSQSCGVAERLICVQQ